MHPADMRVDLAEAVIERDSPMSHLGQLTANRKGSQSDLDTAITA